MQKLPVLGSKRSVLRGFKKKYIFRNSETVRAKTSSSLNYFKKSNFEIPSGSIPI